MHIPKIIYKRIKDIKISNIENDKWKIGTVITLRDIIRFTKATIKSKKGTKAIIDNIISITSLKMAKIIDIIIDWIILYIRKNFNFFLVEYEIIRKINPTSPIDKYDRIEIIFSKGVTL